MEIIFELPMQLLFRFPLSSKFKSLNRHEFISDYLDNCLAGRLIIRRRNRSIWRIGYEKRCKRNRRGARNIEHCSRTDVALPLPGWDE